MKNNVFILTVFFCLSIFAQKNKNYEIIYGFSYQPDSTDIHSKKSEDMVLFTSDSLSLYESFIRYKRDSTMRKNRKKALSKVNGKRILNSKILTGGYIPKIETIIIKDFKNQKFILQKQLVQFYQYEEPAKVDWQIKKDTLTISGYKCQKAITRVSGRNYDVWFAPEVPIPDGPFKFFGLPGLVVQAEDTKGFFQFKLKAIKEIESIHIPVKTLVTPKNHLVVTTKKKYLKAKKNYQNMSISNLLNPYGITIEMDKQEERAMEKKDKNNNPIELE